MLNSDISICNFALSLIGQRPIRSFDEANARARLCSEIYSTAVEIVISRLDWSFARWTEILNTDPSIVVEEGAYAYVIPSDCITPLDVSPFGRDTKWEVMGEYIIASAVDVLKLKYTRRITNPTKFSIPFKNAVANLVAAQLAGPLAGSSVTEIMKMHDSFESDLFSTTVIDASIGSKDRGFDNDPDEDTFNKV